MRQKKISKRKYVNSKLEENKNEAEKDVHVLDNVKVLHIVGTYTLIYCVSKININIIIMN